MSDSTLNHSNSSGTPFLLLWIIPGFQTRISPLPGVEPPVAHVVYRAPVRRGDGPGRLAQDIQFANFRLEWRNEVFTLVVAEWREVYGTRTFTAVLRRGGAEVEVLINTLIIAASAYAQELREEILIYNEGYVFVLAVSRSSQSAVTLGTYIHHIQLQILEQGPCTLG